MGSRILVVEDEANIADYLVTGLREEGYTVEHAAEGISGWLCLQAEPWDLVLLDWWLPGQDGLTLLRRFRERDRRTPVLFLTARDQIQCRVLGLDSGADDYLCKPFDFDELLARVRALIRRRDDSAGAVLSHGDVTVDLTAQRAERAGRPLNLSTKELALLIFFVRNPGRCSPGRGSSSMSGTRATTPNRTLLGSISWNYGASSRLSGPRVIHTLRGRGYCFGEPPSGAPEEGR